MKLLWEYNEIVIFLGKLIHVPMNCVLLHQVCLLIRLLEQREGCIASRLGLPNYTQAQYRQTGISAWGAVNMPLLNYTNVILLFTVCSKKKKILLPFLYHLVIILYYPSTYKLVLLRPHIYHLFVIFGRASYCNILIVHFWVSGVTYLILCSLY